MAGRVNSKIDNIAYALKVIVFISIISLVFTIYYHSWVSIWNVLILWISIVQIIRNNKDKEESKTIIMSVD